MADYDEYKRAVENRAQRDVSFRRQLVRALQPGLENLFDQLIRQTFAQLGKAVADYVIPQIREWLRRRGWA